MQNKPTFKVSTSLVNKLATDSPLSKVVVFKARVAYGEIYFQVKFSSAAAAAGL